MPSNRTEQGLSGTYFNNQANDATNSSTNLNSSIDMSNRISAGRYSEKTGSAINSLPPYVPDGQPLLSGDTENEKAARRSREPSQSSPAVTPPPAYNNINSSHSEGYILFCPALDALTGEAARPRSEPHDFRSDVVQRQTELEAAITQPAQSTPIPKSTDENDAGGSSIVPSPEIKTPERVPSLPHTLPPLDAFESVSFSITMDRSAHVGSLLSQNSASDQDRWRWDIQF